MRLVSVRAALYPKYGSWETFGPWLPENIEGLYAYWAQEGRKRPRTEGSWENPEKNPLGPVGTRAQTAGVVVDKFWSSARYVWTTVKEIVAGSSRWPCPPPASGNVGMGAAGSPKGGTMEHFVLGTPSIPLDRPSSSHRTGRVPFFSLIAGAAIGLLVRWAATLCERCPWCEAWGEDVEPLVLSDPWAGGLSYQCLACGHLWDASGFGERCC